MPRYVDGFLVPIPKKNVEAYRKIARAASKVWMDHGALEYRECVAEDLDVKMPITFPKKIRLKPDETLVFAWITFKSRAHRDRVNAKVMKDARMRMENQPMPFDVKKMLYGGFEVLVDS